MGADRGWSCLYNSENWSVISYIIRYDTLVEKSYRIEKTKIQIRRVCRESRENPGSRLLFFFISPFRGSIVWEKKWALKLSEKTQKLYLQVCREYLRKQIFREGHLNSYALHKK